MAQRLIEVLVPEEFTEEVQEVVSRDDLPPLQDLWTLHGSGGRGFVRILLEARYVEAVMDALSRRFQNTEGFRSVVTEVEASLPLPEESDIPQPEPEVVDPEEVGSKHTFGVARISREELFNDIVDVTRFDGRFIFLTIIATITAAIGLLQDNVAIVVGSMVIAPLLGPIVAQSLATSLADRELGLRALKTNGMGFFIAGTLSFLIGVFVQADPQQVLVTDQMLLRSRPTLWDVGVGLAVGAAGPLAFTTGAPTALVGVMVAAALLPPVVSFGMFLGGGEFVWAAGSLVLVLVYFISANLSGVVTFAAQGVRPAMWWEAERASRSTRVAVAMWSFTLLSLVALIWWFF